MQLLQALFENADLPTDFKEKTTVVFEAAVNEAVAAQLVTIQESFDAKVDTAKEKYVTEAAEAVNAIVESTVLEWAKENAVALDSAAKATLAESFLTDLRGMFEKADIEMSGDAAGQEITKLTESNAKLVTESQELKIQVTEAQAKLTQMNVKTIIDEMTADLPETTAGRARKLCEAFEFKTEADFREKVGMVIEAVAGIKGTFNADGTIVPVIGTSTEQAQANTAAGVHAPEDGELVNKPARAKVKSAEGAKGTPESSQAALRESLQNKIDLVAPLHGKNLIEEAMKLYK